MALSTITVFWFAYTLGQFIGLCIIALIECYGVYRSYENNRIFT